MGMYDSVYFKCPKCGEVIEAQSKRGECTLASFDEKLVPVAIAVDLVGKREWCGHCDRSYTIQRAPEPVGGIPLQLVG